MPRKRKPSPLIALVEAARAYRTWFNEYDGLENNLVVGHMLLGKVRAAVDALDAAVVTEDSQPSC